MCVLPKPRPPSPLLRLSHHGTTNSSAVRCRCCSPRKARPHAMSHNRQFRHSPPEDRFDAFPYRMTHIADSIAKMNAQPQSSAPVPVKLEDRFFSNASSFSSSMDPLKRQGSATSMMTASTGSAPSRSQPSTPLDPPGSAHYPFSSSATTSSATQYNPYGASTSSSHLNPYGSASSSSTLNPYGSASSSSNLNPYGSSSSSNLNPYGSSSSASLNPYGSSSSLGTRTSKHTYL
jgi:hypothetical protein